VAESIFHAGLSLPSADHGDGKKHHRGAIDAARSASAFVPVECKNYGSEIGNPALDQLSFAARLCTPTLVAL
jgi:hypothetical protein